MAANYFMRRGEPPQVPIYIAPCVILQKKLAVMNLTASFDIFPYHAYPVKVFVPSLMILPEMKSDYPQSVPLASFFLYPLR